MMTGKKVYKKKLEDSDIKFLFPESKEFLPVTSPFFIYENKIYRCDTKKFDSIEILEKYIKQNNLAIFYVYESDSTKKSYMLRSANLDTDELKNSAIIEDFVNELKLENYNTEEQIKAVGNIGFIFFIKKRTDGTTTMNQLVSHVYHDGKIYY